jgi:hypothetical protein
MEVLRDSEGAAGRERSEASFMGKEILAESMPGCEEFCNGLACLIFKVRTLH